MALPNMSHIKPYENRLMSLEEACRRLDIGMTTLRRQVRNGFIHAVKVGGHYKISEEEIQRIFHDGLTSLQTVRRINS